MGLLGTALATGIGGAAGTAAQGIQENIKTQHDKDLMEAQYQKEANLVRLRNQFAVDAADTAYGRQMSGKYDPDTGYELSNNEASQYDQGTLIGKPQADQQYSFNPNFTLNGAPATNQEVKDATEANRQIGQILSDAKKRALSKNEAIQLKNDIEEAQNTANQYPGMAQLSGLNDRLSEMKSQYDAIQPDQFTPEEQEAFDSWQPSAGLVGDVRKDAQSAKAELEMNKLQEKYAALKEITESKLASAKEISDAKLQMAQTIVQWRVLGGLSGNDHFTLSQQKDMAGRLREAQRSYDAAVKGKDPDAIAQAVDGIVALNESAKDVGVTPLPVPKRPTTTEEDMNATAQAQDAVKKNHPIKSFFGFAPDKAEVQQVKRGLLATAGQRAGSQPGRPSRQDVAQQAYQAIQTVNADRTLTAAQKSAKINAIQARAAQYAGY